MEWIYALLVGAAYVLGYWLGSRNAERHWKRVADSWRGAFEWSVLDHRTGRGALKPAFVDMLRNTLQRR